MNPSYYRLLNDERRENDHASWRSHCFPQKQGKIILFLLLCLALTSPRAWAFSLLSSRVRTSRRHSSSFPNGDFETDLEQARAHFEALLSGQLITPEATTALPLSKKEYSHPPLTESSRCRRRIEMDLLASLKESDDAIDELMSLWMVERDVESARRLQEMEHWCSSGLVEEELALRRMIEEYGVDWVEPISRLAALLFYKGETEESELWCRVALAVKPWHFEVIQTLVLSSLRRQDFPSALRWRRKALPPLNGSNHHRLRKAWVSMALEEAQESLAKAQTSLDRLEGGGLPTSGEVWQ